MTDDVSPAPEPSTAESAHPFAELEDFVALPRGGSLLLSPDGERLVVSVATLNPERTKYLTALWDVDPSGSRPARRLTRGAKGESGAAFLPDGSLLFTAARPDPEAKEEDDPPPSLWMLPAGAGEARVLATRPGGLSGVKVARGAGTVLVSSATLPGSGDGGDDERRRKVRKDRKVSAILHEGYPVRFWDHDLGPDFPRLLVGDPTGQGAGQDRLELRDLTPEPDGALVEGSYDLTPDGSTAVASWRVPGGHGSQRSTLVAIDVDTGERRVLADDADYEYDGPVVSPDGRWVAVSRMALSTPEEPLDFELVLLPLAGGAANANGAANADGGGRSGDQSVVLTEGWDRWASCAQWLPDSSALMVVADDDGRAPVFRIDVTTREVTRLTRDDAAYSELQVSPDGRSVYALRLAIDSPATPVRLDATTPDQQPTRLAVEVNGRDVGSPSLPGTLTEVRTTAPDGRELRAWLVLPEGAGATDPAPLLLWIHGGPLSSWNAWSWRWNPWVAAARGYAVLLPDPALSTGYGLDFIRRGWGAWGEAPYTDLMAVTDAAQSRDDVDETRTAAMGGSFGGYMANWVAGHTDRFKAVVTHASLWALDQFGPTTDAAYYWTREMSEEMAMANSPHLHASRIVSPMLVIHGDKDYRVPIGEGLRLWWDLARQHQDAGEMPHKFLYFPDENHWILGPQHAIVWYETVFAFLDHHVLGKDWTVPEILR